MLIRVLGPVDVLDDEGDGVAVGGPLQTRLLVLLVVAGSERLSVDEAVAGLWPSGDLPEDPIGTVRTYVARLRRSLGGDAIVTVSGAYQLGDVSTDASQFEELVERARRVSGSPTAAELWRKCLDLWRGRAFGRDAELEAVVPEAARLEELRAEATEAWFDARLAAGEGRELASEVETAVKAFPFREGFRVQQMTVLARAGRQADALRAFQEFRAELTEVGLEPSEPLAELDRRIAGGEVPRSGARRTLRGYELGERIGEGAFAQVWAATQASVDRKVAIKQIRASLANEPEFIRQFETEAQLVARLEHPHVVPLYDYWREPGSAYLVMRYVDGGSLANALLDGPVDLDRVVALAQEVAAALDEAHREGVIHRDVKPGNILLDRSGNAYLSDFGIAVEEAGRLDPEAWLSNGSPAYAPPEQLQRLEAGPAADVYALGMTVYEALTGRLPFPAETTMAGLLERQLNDPVPLVRTTLPELPAAVDSVLQKATAKMPAGRYQSAGAFAVDLAAAAGLKGDEALITPEDRNPYKGLRAFTEADAGDFAGRARLVNRLVDRLGAHRVTVVVGPSGSGKSSVVRAGLLPAVRQGRIPGSDQWFTTTMIPSTDPFTDLEAALLRVAIDTPADLAQRLTVDRRGLAWALRRLVPANRQLLLFVDQFEELFTLGDDAAKTELFLDSLVEALTVEDPQLRLVVTLRADFYDRPLRYDRFADLIEDATVAVHPLAADELERAITQPAAAVGVSFEAGLVAQITADVADQPGGLPLLQYTLTELFEQRVDHTLTHDAYRRLGGVNGSITRRADEIFDQCTGAEREAARRVCTRLVTLGEGTEDTRRRVLRSELGDNSATTSVIEGYGIARLISFDRDPVSREQTVEVAHEALIQQWARLRDWLDDDRDGLRTLRHITETAKTWDERGREDSELYRGGRLEAAREWAATHTGELARTETEFLDASDGRQQAELAAEKRQLSRLRRLLGAVAVVATIALIAGVVAVVQGGRANERAADAEFASLVSQALVEAGVRPDVSMLLAAEAQARRPGPEAERALLASLAGSSGLVTRITESQHSDPTGNAGFCVGEDADGSLVSASITPEQPDEWIITNTATREVNRLVVDTPIRCAMTLSPNDRYAVGTEENQAQQFPDSIVFDLETKETILREPFVPMGWTLDGRLIFLAFPEPGSDIVDIHEYDPATGQRTVHPLGVPWMGGGMQPGGAAIGINVFDPDTETFEARRYDTTSFELTATFTDIGADPAYGHESLEAGLYALIDEIGTVRVWALDTAEIVTTFDAQAPSGQISFSPSGKLLAVSRRNSSVLVANARTGRTVAEIELPDSAGFIRWAAEDEVAVLYASGIIDVFSIAGGSLASQQWGCCTSLGPLQSIEIQPEAESVLVTTSTGTVELVDDTTGTSAQFQIERGPGGDIVQRTDGAAVRVTSELGGSVWTADGQVEEWDPHPLGRVAGNSGTWNGHLALLASTTATDERQVSIALLDLDTPSNVTLIPIRDVGGTGTRFKVLPSPDGVLIGLASGDVIEVDLTGTVLRQFKALNEIVRDMELSDDGSVLAAVSPSGRIVVHDYSTEEVLLDSAVAGEIQNVTFSPSGSRLVSADANGRARLWDIEAGLEIGILSPGGQALTGRPSWLPDESGVWISFDGTLFLIDLDPKEWVETACRLAARELTEDERSELLPPGIGQEASLACID